MSELTNVNEDINLKRESQRREDYICWEDYFMGIAFLAAQRSKDPVTQVGACIVNEDKRIVSIGYNGMPAGVDDFPWGKGSPEQLQHKKLYVCHAEANAILCGHGVNYKGCTMYVSQHPCSECAKLIIQSGIKSVKYVSEKFANKPTSKAARKMFNVVGIAFRQYKPEKKQLLIDFAKGLAENSQNDSIE
ncbi:Probable deoxycytidylate deaminase [Anthophora plagiata]